MDGRSDDRVRTWRPEGLSGVVCLAGPTRSYAIEPYDEYVVGTVEHGAMIATRRGRGYAVGSRDLVRWDPSSAHAGRAADGHAWRARLLLVELPAMRRWALDEDEDTEPALIFDDPVLTRPDLAAALVRLHGALAGPSSLLEREIGLMAVLGTAARAGRVAAAPAPGGRRRPEPAVRVAREYLEAHPSRNVTLDELAAASGVGRFRLVRAFTAQVGVAPHRFQLARRLSAARRALESGADISAAAAATGFADQSHLHRHFRRAYATTPAAYKRAFSGR